MADPSWDIRTLEVLLPGGRLFTEGELGSEVYLIEEGEVELRKTIHGEDRQVLVLGPGDIAGAESLDHPARRQFSARTRTVCRLLRFDETSEERVRVLDFRLRARAQDSLQRSITRLDELMAESPSPPQTAIPTSHAAETTSVVAAPVGDTEDLPLAPSVPAGRRYLTGSALAALAVIALVAVGMRAAGPDPAARTSDPRSDRRAAYQEPEPTPQRAPLATASPAARDDHQQAADVAPDGPPPPTLDPAAAVELPPPARHEPRRAPPSTAPSAVSPEPAQVTDVSPAVPPRKVGGPVTAAEEAAASPPAATAAPAPVRADRPPRLAAPPDSRPSPAARGEASTGRGKPPAPAPEPADPEPELIPPELLRSPPLRYPNKARRLNKQAEVRIRVLVDERGRVVEVEAPDPPIGYGFDEAAMAIARRCEFAPATRGGIPVAAWTAVDFAYRLK